MNTVFYEYPTIGGDTIKVLIAPTSEDSSKVRFNICQMTEDYECKANVCVLITKEIANLFVHHLTDPSACASEPLKCECGGILEVL